MYYSTCTQNHGITEEKTTSLCKFIKAMKVIG